MLSALISIWYTFRGKRLDFILIESPAAMGKEVELPFYFPAAVPYGLPMSIREPVESKK